MVWWGLGGWIAKWDGWLVEFGVGGVTEWGWCELVGAQDEVGGITEWGGCGLVGSQDGIGGVLGPGINRMGLVWVGGITGWGWCGFGVWDHRMGLVWVGSAHS